MSHESPQRAFVSASLRPYLLASLLDSDPERPALIVAGDDRAARDLAADLKAYLAPRPVRFYPARGMRYESHLAPPPHLVGLRIAALDSLLERPGRRPRDLRGRARREGARPGPAPARLRDREGRPARPRGDGRPARRLRLRARRPGRGARPVRDPRRHPRRLSGDRGARRPLRAVRRGGRAPTWFSTFTQRSLEEADRVEIAPAAELAPEHRELAEIAAETEESERPDIAEVLPVDRFRELLDLVPDDAVVAIAAEEELAPALRDYWEDVTTSFHDDDAHHLYVKPEALDAALDRRARLRLSSISQDQPHEFRAQSADTAARSLRDAEPSSRSSSARATALRGVVAPRRGRARPAQHGPDAGRLPRREAGARGPVAHVRPREPARRLHRASAEARRRCPSTACFAAAAPSARRTRRDRLVHRTSARARPWCTRTTASPSSPASRRRPSAA